MPTYSEIMHGRKHDHSLALDNNILNPLSLNIGGTSVITSSRHLENIVAVAQHFVADEDDTRDFGSPSIAWRNLYIEGNIIVGTTDIVNRYDNIEFYFMSASSYLNGAIFRLAGGDHVNAGNAEIYIGDRRAGKTPNSIFQIRYQANGALTIIATLDKTGLLNTLNGFSVGGVVGATGSFTTVDGKTVTVTKGIITSIV